MQFLHKLFASPTARLAIVEELCCLKGDGDGFAAHIFFAHASSVQRGHLS
jgi:hypothetical protein